MRLIHRNIHAKDEYVSMDRAIDYDYLYIKKNSLQLAHAATCERCKQQRVYQKLRVIFVQHIERDSTPWETRNKLEHTGNRWKSLVEKLEEGNSSKRREQREQRLNAECFQINTSFFSITGE
jgi:hypothetical protein